MPKFKYEEKIPSCHISKDLLVEIQEFLHVEMPKKYGQSLGDKIEYRISISERVGTETLDTIKDYTLSIFPNDINGVEVVWDNGYSAETRLDISVRFASNPYNIGSEIRISCVSPLARETAESIGNQLLRILNSHKNHNWLLNPTRSGGIPLLVGLLAALMFYSVLVLGIAVGINFLTPWILTVGALMVWYSLSGFFRRFYTFETARQNNLNALWKWFTLGTIGFVIFGTLFPWLKTFLD